mmetsp:Transcript_4215/g.7839  ORF Transcript_4215/g.7839 Transcript_4215/m.7839 type:complete len:125 (+) Transcript_4215:389-763(+)|eukprot:CAMPEP_0184411726 /NCGR_PEP_ID=MMETSP0738-20130409/5903_1 /TAXON_ID=385413 /ORGANISM="Thalassiosira miniscula, Strain CCMP1093" /LENGTH=124 /DNA_ID=CAMNT_0026770039 /DNA_START=277 /DNA_END=651 /DNA_ORIENTATION=+
MFERELDYYGITPVGGISDRESIPKMMDSLTASLAEAKKKHDMFALALEFYYQFCRHRLNFPSAEGAYDVALHKDHKLFASVGFLNGEKRKLFDNYFEQYFGLMVPAQDKVYLDGRSFFVGTKK